MKKHETTSTRAAAWLVLVTVCAGLVLGGCSTDFDGNDTEKDDLVVDFSGFSPNIGDTFYMKVTDREPSTGDYVSQVITPMVIGSDSFRITMPDVIQEGRRYNIDFWADVDGNGTLDRTPNGTPAGVDQSWRIRRTGGTNTLHLTFNHNTNWTDITPF